MNKPQKPLQALSIRLPRADRSIEAFHLSEPRIEHLATLWTVRGPSNRDLTCCAYRVQTGLELRIEYSPDDIVASQLFRGRDADERLCEKADVGRLTLIATGFREIAT